LLKSIKVHTLKGWAIQTEPLLSGVREEIDFYQPDWDSTLYNYPKKS
jgi:secreted protein with Ig-like and vWFA domain